MAPEHWFARRVCRACVQRALAAFAVACGLSLLPAAARAGCELRQMSIPVRMVGWRPVATLSVNGTPVQLLVASGSFTSSLTRSVATQLSLPLRPLRPGLVISKYRGKADYEQTVVERLGLLDGELRNVEFLVDGNELGAGIQGSLGRNFLAAGDTEYDLAQGVIKVTLPSDDCAQASLAYWAGSAPVVVLPLTEREPSTEVVVPVRVNGEDYKANLSTDSPYTVLGRHVARGLRIPESDWKPAGQVGTWEKRIDRWEIPVAMFEVGGERISNLRLMLDDVLMSDPEDLLLGVDYMLAHRIYVSYKQRKVYITWNGGPAFLRSPSSEATYDLRQAALPVEVPAGDADALARRGAASLTAGLHAKALQDLNRACELAPTVAEYFRLRARLHFAMKQPRLSLADLDRALLLDPAQDQARIQRAWERRELGDASGALADLALLDLNLPQSAHLRAELGRQLERLDQFPDALRQFALWLDHHPNDFGRASVLNSRCWLRARTGLDLALALQDCQLAVQANAQSSDFHDSLGWTYLRRGEPAQAKSSFDTAIALKPQAYSLYGRSLALRHLKDDAGAERDLIAARKLEPSVDDRLREDGFDLAGLLPAATSGRQP